MLRRQELSGIFWPVRAVVIVLVGVLEYILGLQGMLGGRGGWGHSKTRVKENLRRTFLTALDMKAHVAMYFYILFDAYLCFPNHHVVSHGIGQSCSIRHGITFSLCRCSIFSPL